MHLPLRDNGAGRQPALTTTAFLLFLACHPAMDMDRTRTDSDVLAMLRARGEAPVMIALTEPAGYADATADAAWIRSEIARLQAEVVAALDSADYRERHRFVAIPAMSGVVRSERGLEVLLSHPHVRRVDLDPGGTGTR